MAFETKKILKQIAPPIFVNAGKRILANAEAKKNSPEKFANWWRKYSTKKELDQNLKLMMNHYLTTSEASRSSLYWNYLSKKNIEQIADHGISNFKQTVATNYYTWIDGISGQFGKNIVKDAGTYDLSIPLSQLFKKHDFLSREQSILFNSMTTLLYAYVKKKTKLADLAEESTFGNSLFIEIEGKRISQDILNSVIEYDSIVEQSKITPKSIIEIGAGSGRTAEFFLKAQPNLKYFIADIPPALFVSQSYLSQAFPNRKVFKFRPFSSFESIQKELEQSTVAFFTPDQLALLPEKFVDLFMAIDCLHEMKSEQIKLYFSTAEKLAKNFYFKAWHDTSVPFDNERLVEKGYPIPKNWKKIFHRDCYVPGAYFEGYYET